jgi:hypothetical protein
MARLMGRRARIARKRKGFAMRAAKVGGLGGEIRMPSEKKRGRTLAREMNK